MARLTRSLVVGSLLIVASVSLSSCGSGGAVADARRSCQSVERALKLETLSLQPGITTGRRAQLQSQALSQLLKATPSAADATSIDGSWNPLMTTIGEAERVPIPELIPALRRLCRVANSSTPYL